MNKFDDTQLYHLLISNDLSAIDKFLNKFGLDSVDRDQRTFLMSAIVEKKIDIVKHLLDIGADVNIHEKIGLTALHFAALENNLEIIKLLIESGAEIDAIDNQGNTPLWRAIMTTDGDSDISKYLVSKGADLDQKNKHGVSPRDLL
ncbi:ankyrin repeat domain-containing protein [Acinetobacter gerneri]|uniref:ankyrin repeat domain-containing protein n=1 Tax=Acinetobacter gerneri TaxID=202952 RepID=UPI0028ABE403|nr:ankyrin repeat domain-containing protein [Acinetobacter gerneri]